MPYIIIHQNSKTLEDCIVKTINKHLPKKVNSLKQVLHDPDFCIVQKEEKGNIKIEQVKNLQKKLLYSPFNKTHQFGIIKEANLMTQEAQNALLKTLEECHEKTILILTVKNETSVLQTILSRCTRIYPNECNSELEDISEFSEVEEFLELPIYDQINKIENIVKNKETEEFSNNLIKFFREKHTEKIKTNEDSGEEAEVLEMLLQTKYRITKNVNSKIALEYLCFKINHNQDTYKK
jgi:uncharacterized protein (UPF0216 family)